LRIAQALTGQPIDLKYAQKVADEFDFRRVKAQADLNRPSGTEIPFVREGSLGGWKNHFSEEAMIALADNGYLDAMKKLSYMDGSYPLFAHIK
jgi:hypothetical protein